MNRKILNGVVGDYLEATGNELTIPMSLLKDGKPIDSSSDSSTGNRICILVHGLIQDESVWQNEVIDFDQALQRDLNGLTNLFLRYNTGLHISTSGRQLNRLLESLNSSFFFTEVDEIAFLCHSMGGLVVRSACTYGMEEGASWVQKVGHVVFLGTPHQGSYWEKAGSVLSHSLRNLLPRPYLGKLASDICNLRSDGIQDLRFGYIRDEDWQGREDNVLLQNTKTKNSAVLLDSALYYVATGSITSNPENPLSIWFGDALVRKSSAQGHSENEEHHLPFQNFCEFPGIGHNELVKNEQVYKKIVEWLKEPWSPPEESSIMIGVTHGANRIPNKNAEHGLSKSDAWKGTTSLVQSAVHAGTVAVGAVQREMTSEVYSVLSRCVPIAPAVGCVQRIHETAVDGVYGCILGINHVAGETVKYAIDYHNKKPRHEQDLQE